MSRLEPIDQSIKTVLKDEYKTNSPQKPVFTLYKSPSRCSGLGSRQSNRSHRSRRSPQKKESSSAYRTSPVKRSPHKSPLRQESEPDEPINLNVKQMSPCKSYGVTIQRRDQRSIQRAIQHKSNMQQKSRDNSNNNSEHQNYTENIMHAYKTLSFDQPTGGDFSSTAIPSEKTSSLVRPDSSCSNKKIKHNFNRY